ncbi:MAG: response regulator [Planctomycetes bacterium]|nr:response regulator [Planctomycetota bacterium]
MDNASRAGDLGPLANAADECLVFDLEGRFVSANEAALRALGCAAEELAGRHAWDLCTCLTPNGFEHMLEAIRVEGPQSLLGHLRRGDGGLVATDTRFWTATHGGELRVMALAREMRGYQGVIDERDQLSDLVEASSEAVLLFDGELRVTYANAAALAQLGFERAQDIEGVAMCELVVPEQRAFVEERVVPHLEREAWDGELELRSWRDPAARTPCWAHAFAVRNSRTQRRVGYALTARDVSARRAADRRRTRLLELAEVSRRVALQLLGQGDLNQAVFEILAGVARVLGVARGTLHRLREDGRWLLRTHEWTPEGGSIHQKDGPAHAGQECRWLTALLEHGESLRIDDSVPLEAVERELLDPGERALLALTVAIHGRLESVFCFVHERQHTWEDDEIAAVRLIVDAFARGVERQIAEREKDQARRELEQAVQREQVASRYKSEFLASMSHELRTPMNAIRGYAELLARPQIERALQETWIQNLRRSSEYLLGLIHDVLDLSKIEAGHMPLERESTSLAEILGSVEDLLSASAREKGLEFTLALEGELPEHFETDPVRLKQILVNLAGNAIKFTSQGSVALRVRRGPGAGEHATLALALSDTGIGIPPEAIDKLFQPFSQVNQRSGGTGLGLQISRSLARLLGGDIRVTSEVEKGSVFTLELPLHGARGTLHSLPPRGAVPALARALPDELREKRILVVDDSFENREVLRFLLQEAGASSESAMDGQAGVERALAAEQARTPFDAILMDMNMPVVDGFEATRRLVRAGVSSPVIALTALALRGDEERCRAAGCVAYVVKPIVPSVFFDTLAKHLRPAPPRSTEPASERGTPRADTDADRQVLSLAQHPRFRGLVERYVSSFPELAQRIRQLERQGNYEAVRTLVHRLRGTAASYGFAGLSQAAGRCEDGIRAGAAREELARQLDDLVGRLTVAAAG